MKALHPSHPLRIFWFSSLVTVLLGVIVALYGSLTDLWLYVILVLLEVTFSFDNAVINSKVLSKMSRVWQLIFLTVGIFVAVFVVRFALPILIVMLAADTSFLRVVDLALNDPDQYSVLLHGSSVLINSFGGGFLLMLSLSYFFDITKRRHWIKPLEVAMIRTAKILPIAAITLMSLVAAIVYITVGETDRSTVIIAVLAGSGLQIGLQLIARIFYARQSRAGLQVGWAAFASFMYLEILDASFSFDSVVAAFAVTSGVLLIVAGLGAGAIWVRSLTIYLLRSGTLTKYRYLENGAHWAILALGFVMIGKLYSIEPPEWIVGSLGLAFISSSVLTSIIEKRRQHQASPTVR